MNLRPQRPTKWHESSATTAHKMTSADMAHSQAAAGNTPCIGQQVTQQWWHGDIDGKQMQFGGVLEEANGCDDLRPGEMECTLKLPCLTCFG